MRRLALPGLACALAVAVVGCGPMTSPLPPRLDEQGQAKVDEGWNRAFTPADKYDHAALLDVMVGTQAYQLGVDTFHLRAEKKCAGGTVVMEVNFDRARPDDDRFEVTVNDTAGKPIRRERYSRKEVEEAYAALCAPAGDPNDPALAARRADYEKRWQRIREVFPDAKEEPKPPAAPLPRAKG